MGDDGGLTSNSGLITSIYTCRRVGIIRDHSEDFFQMV